MSTTQPDLNVKIAYVNARLLDPTTGLDAMGGILTEGETITQVDAGLFANSSPGARHLPPQSMTLASSGTEVANNPAAT